MPISRLADPAFLENFAFSVAEGMTSGELAEEFDISPHSVRQYRKDNRVKAAALKHVEDRILRVTRKTDSTMDALIASDAFRRLNIIDQMSLLLKVRREYLGNVLRMQAEAGKATAGDINAAMDTLESDPKFAAEVRALMEREG